MSLIAEHVPLVVTAATTRAQIQAEIAYWRGKQRAAVIESTAAEHGAVADGYLDALLALEPEPT